MRSLAAGLVFALGFALASVAVAAPPASAPAAQAATPGAAAGKVVVSGTVPDRATASAVLEKLRGLYGPDQVVDNLAVGGVVTPANWSRHVEGMIGPDLKQISKGELKVAGNAVSIHGEVPNEAVRQAVLSRLAGAFDSHFGITQKLVVGESRQAALDQTLADRTIEFDSGSATLTPSGAHILDEMATTIGKLDNPFILIVGNTDNVGNATTNLQLSLARAEAVKRYLVDKGIPAADLSASGQGADNPVAGNDTPGGRARNRRIDFRIVKQ